MTSCDSWNVCRTCDGFSNEKSSSSSDDQGGVTVEDSIIDNNEDGENEKDEYGCRAVPEEYIPKVKISEFGMIEPGNIHAIKAELYARYGDKHLPVVRFFVPFYLYLSRIFSPSRPSTIII